MLPKEYKLKRENDFKAVFNKGRYYQVGFIKLKIFKNNFKKNRFGCSIGLKVSKKATQRNKIKRRIEEVIRLNTDRLTQGFDIVIMVDSQITEKNYGQIKEELVNLFKKAGLFAK
ncbi:MAG: ribonuclease P protein component [Patescibacteria group bacterium]|nr:ribonuclease P protein component [Patescibacteria group bacterium]